MVLKLVNVANAIGWGADKPAETCSICLEDFKAEEFLLKLPCSHIFHPDEIENWLKISDWCPMCRQGCLRLLVFNVCYEGSHKIRCLDGVRHVFLDAFLWVKGYLII